MKTILSIDDRTTLAAIYPGIPFHYIGRFVKAGEEMLAPRGDFPERADHQLVFRMAVMAFVNWRLAERGSLVWFAMRDQFDSLRIACREIDDAKI